MLSSAIVVGLPAKMLYCLFSSEASYSSQRQQHLGGMFAASTAEDMLQTSLAKATTSRWDVCSKYFPSLGTSFPRKGNNCKPSIVACVSPISPGASVKGELLPTSPRELALLLSLFRLICLVSRIWMIHADSPTTASLRLQLVFRPYPLARQ